MMLIHHVWRIAAIAVTGFLTSCIDVHEEYWLDSSGGGRAEISYQVPAAVAGMHGGEAGIREMLEGFLKNTPELTKSACTVTTVDKRIHVNVSAAFDSALDLRKIAHGGGMKSMPSAASHIAGKITAGIHGRTLDFQRVISPGKALPGVGLLPAAQFEGHRLTYIVHLPTAARESNATRVEDSGRTLVWDWPLEKAVKTPVITRFKADIPIPWALVATVITPLSLAGVLVVVRLRKSRNPR